MHAARDRQKSLRRSEARKTTWEFQVGDKVMLKVRLGKGSSYVLANVGKSKPRAEQSSYNSIVSKPEKCHCRRTISVSVDGLNLDDKLHFVEEPVEIVGRED
ncbi:hypothetical protein Tco_0240988 [Tanacetum coccineum]